MTDRERLAEMRKLGVKWPAARVIPTYPSTMTEAQTAEADALYDSMSKEFIDQRYKPRGYPAP